jgi:radical SAM protein with 4Fe4S-binding SPASM domain
MIAELRRLLPTKLWNERVTEVVLDAINLAKYRTRDFFKVVEIETTTACNRACSYCPNSKFDRGQLRNEKLMEVSTYRKIVDQLADLRFWGRLSPHFYGEPLLDKRLVELMAYTRRRLPLTKLVIFTNGDLLSPELYQRFAEAGIDGFLVTQHGPKEPSNLVRLRRHRSEPGAARLRFDYRSFTSETELSNRAGLVDHDVLETKQDCLLPSENVTIDYEGNVILCCNDYHSSIKFGNVNQSHLGDIWSDERFRRIRHNLAQGVFDLEICKKCASGRKGLAE